MKTSLFDMTFTLPPMLEITEVEKDLSQFNPTAWYLCTLLGDC